MSGLNTKVQGENTNAFNTANTNYNNLVGTFGKMTVDPALSAALNKDYAPGAAAGSDATDLKALQNQESNLNISNLTPDQLSQLGVSSEQMNNLARLQLQLLNPTFIPSGNSGNGSAYTQSVDVPLSTWLTANAPVQSNFANATPDEIAQGNALNAISGTNQFVAPTAGPVYTAPTFDYNAALNALQLANARNLSGARVSADQIAAQQQAAHDALNSGSILGALGKDFDWSNPTNFLNTVSSINPLSWSSNFQNVINGKPVSGRNMNPFSPDKSTI